MPYNFPKKIYSIFLIYGKSKINYQDCRYLPSQYENYSSNIIAGSVIFFL